MKEHSKDSSRVCVVTPNPLLVIEIEPTSDDAPSPKADVHTHLGGQGLWVARMAASLGAQVTVCGPFGGEIGSLLIRMLEQTGISLHAVPYGRGNGASVYDRRAGEREELAVMGPPRLSRHEVDDLFGSALVAALDSDVCVLTGAHPSRVIPASFFSRLTRDVRAAGTLVVADLSGPQAMAAIEAEVDVLKISDEEMLAGGFAEESSEANLREAATRLIQRGVGAVVVSRAGEPALVVTAEGSSRLLPPSVSTVDHRGAGDSMTAGIAVAMGRGASVLEAAQLGAAAGALNVTRRGLGTGRREQVERFATRVLTEEIT